MADPGQILAGRYRLDAILGQGGFGMVYRAEDVQRPGTFWAVKELNLSFASPDEAQEARGMLEREQKILSWLSHPGIVVRREVLADGNTVYLVMELVEGEDLDSVLARHPYSIHQSAVVELADQVLDVLVYLHSQKPYPIIFRDLKPSNLILTKSGRVKVIDFGIARLYDPRSHTTSSSLSLKRPTPSAPAYVTRHLGRVADTVCMGTPGYAAPEQYPGSGTQTDGRADIYALGVLMHQLLTRLDPGTLGIPLPPIRDTLAELDGDLEAIILKATSVDRSHRFPSAMAFRNALRNLRTHRWRENPHKGVYELCCLARPELSVTDYEAELSEALAQADRDRHDGGKRAPTLVDRLTALLRRVLPK